MTIREFVRTIWAGKYYVLGAVLVVVVAALAFLDRQETVYEATATVQIIPAESVPGADQAASTVTVDTDASFVRAGPVVQAAAVALGTDEDPGALATTVQGFYNGDLQTMEITAQGSEPQIAVDRANAFAQAYVAYLPTVLAGQIADLDQRQTKLRAQLATIQGEIAAQPNDPLAGAERDTVIQQYTAISAQRSTFESIVAPAQLITPATTAKPLGLGAPVVLAIAVLLGLVAGVGLAFARRGLDFRVRSSAEAAALADSPVLAELYGVRAAERDYRRNGVLPVSSRTASPYTESIRELRTAVQVSIGNVGHSVVAVTAADPHAPRAFITANLAASFALSGRRTIVVPGDLRRPQVAELLAAPEDWDGPTNALRPTRVPNLSVMPVHDEEMDPADFLATAAVRQLVQDMGDDAAVVVIDSPPVLAAADATILGGYAHGVVLVASAGQTDRIVLKEAADRLRINDVPLSGLAMTGLQGERRMIYASTYGADGEVRDIEGAEGIESVEGVDGAEGVEGVDSGETSETSPPREDVAPGEAAPTDESTAATDASPEPASPEPASPEPASPEPVILQSTSPEPTPTDLPDLSEDDAVDLATPVEDRSDQDGAPRSATPDGGSLTDSHPAREHVPAHAIPVGRVFRPGAQGSGTTGEPVGPQDRGPAPHRPGQGDQPDESVRAHRTVKVAPNAAAGPNDSESRRRHRAKRLSPEWAKVRAASEARAENDEDDNSEPRRRPFRW